MGDNSMDFFKNPPVSRRMVGNGDCGSVGIGNCTTASSDGNYTITTDGLTKILAKRNDEDIRKLIKECNLTWDGYSNNPDFMNDPIGAE